MPTQAITYSAHAIDRMRERNISPRQVEQTVFFPAKLTRGTGSRVSAERVTTRGNTIRVIYEERIGPSGRTAHIITVMRISPR